MLVILREIVIVHNMRELNLFMRRMGLDTWIDVMQELKNLAIY